VLGRVVEQDAPARTVALGTAKLVDDGVARNPVDPPGEMFAVLDPVEVAVDPQHDLPEDVVRAVRVVDATPDERLQLCAELPPDLLGRGIIRPGPAGTRGSCHLGSSVEGNHPY
jgi:hypothetical protein